MHEPWLKLHQLRCLVMLAETGSIRGTSLALGVSQPAVTKSISELERDLKVSLVNRGTRGTTLTESGKALLPRARTIENEVRRAREDIEQIRHSHDQQGSIGIGASALSAITLIPPALKALRQQYPRARLDIVDGLFPGVAGPLREGVLDVVLGPLPPPRMRGEFVYEQLFICPTFVVARRGHPLARSHRLADLAGAQRVTAGPLGRHGPILDELFSRNGMRKPSVSVRMDSLVPIQALIAGTDLLGILPKPLFDGLNNLPIEPIPIKDRVPEVAIGLFMRAGSRISPIAETFVDLVRQHARTLQASFHKARLHATEP